MDKDFTNFITTMAQALYDGTLRPGRLMSPDEIDHALAGRKDEMAQLRGWFLCGTANPAMFSTDATAELQSYVEVLETRAGVSYLLVIQQRAGWQSRCILPLAGLKVHQYVQSLISGQVLQLSLGVGDGDYAVISSLSLQKETIEALARARIEARFEDSSHLDSLTDVVSSLLNASALRPIEGMPAIHHTSLSVVMPGQLGPCTVENSLAIPSALH